MRLPRNKAAARSVRVLLPAPDGFELSFADQCRTPKRQNTDQTGQRSVPSGGTSIPSAELRSTRKPWLLFRLSGEFLLRFADRQFLALLSQLPPRFTRFEPMTTDR